MDNRQFNVKGRSLVQLKLTLDLLLTTEYPNDNRTTYAEKKKVEAWKFDPERGLVLYNYIPKGITDANPFPISMNSDNLAFTLWEWLNNSDQSKNYIIKDPEDVYLNFDGSNYKGFRVYKVNDWGVAGVVVPAWCWYGK